MILFLLIIIGCVIAVSILDKFRIINAEVPFAISGSALREDLRRITTASGFRRLLRDNQDVHFLLTLLIVTGVNTALIGFEWLQFQNFAWGELFAVSYIEALLLNGIREEVKRQKGGKEANGKDRVPFSWRDVRFGTYATPFITLATIAIKYYWL